MMTPVVALMETPAGAVNVPPVVKPDAKIGVGFVPFEHTGVVYEKLVTGVVEGLIVTTALWVSVQVDVVVKLMSSNAKSLPAEFILRLIKLMSANVFALEFQVYVT